jgi:probable rRNA maturation factor
VKKFGKIPEISIHNAQRRIRVNCAELEDFAERALKLCLQVPTKTPTDLMRLKEVGIVIVSDKRMTDLHRRFMGIAGPTDVITFQHGEIFVNIEEAKRNARRFGNSLGQELQLYIVHGLLHLHGLDDRDGIGAKKMERVQRRILQQAIV